MIEPLDRSRLPEAAAVLGAAFRNTPLFSSALRGIDEPGRERRLTGVFRSFAAACLGRGAPRVVLTDGRISAVALIYPPGRYPLSLGAWLRNGSGVLALGPGRTITLARVDSFLQAHHYMEPHWYLYVLGVAPALQGQGLGGALVREMSAQAGGELPCYLETDDPKNVGYYERFGYQVTHQAPLPSLPDVNMWSMLRAAGKP